MTGGGGPKSILVSGTEEWGLKAVAEALRVKTWEKNEKEIMEKN